MHISHLFNLAEEYEHNWVEIPVLCYVIHTVPLIAWLI